MDTLDGLLAGTLQPGIYRYEGREHPASIDDLLAGHGWRSFYLDGRLVTDKQSFLEAVALAMAFPGYVGRNWDALEEAVRDLEWVPATGYLLIFDYPQVLAALQPEDWRTILAILQSAIDFWRARDVPMFVLLRKTTAGLDGIPWLDQ